MNKNLATGIRIESEHKDVIQKLKRYLHHKKRFPPNKEVFKWIVQSHEKEFPNGQYYPALVKMEAKLKAKRKKRK